MATYNSKQVIITVDIATRALKITDENGKPGRRLNREQMRSLYDSGLTEVATILQSKRSHSKTETCIVVRVDGTEIIFCI
jgi:hypothetical protein